MAQILKIYTQFRWSIIDKATEKLAVYHAFGDKIAFFSGLLIDRRGVIG
jgi:hypothetical protein